VRAAFAKDQTALASALRTLERAEAVWPWIVATAATVLMASAFFIFAITPTALFFESLGRTLPYAALVTIGLSHILAHWWFLLIPLLVGFQVGISFLLRRVGGNRLVRWWSTGVMAGLGLIVVMAVLSLLLLFSSFTR
jgi:type II secretory pathway component PulF